METFSKQQPSINVLKAVYTRADKTNSVTRVCRTMVPHLLMEHRKESWKKGQRGRFKEGKKVAGGR